MVIQNNLYNTLFEDTGSFGDDTLTQNAALAAIINSSAVKPAATSTPVTTPTATPVATSVVPVATPVTATTAPVATPVASPVATPTSGIAALPAAQTTAASTPAYVPSADLIKAIQMQGNALPFDARYDIDGDGKITAADVTAIRNGASLVAPKPATPVAATATPTTPAATPATTPATTPAATPAKVDYTSALAKQILGQGLTSKWTGTGFGSAEANAADMAKILAGIGITDINQFGKITKTIPGYSYETEQGTVNVPAQTVTTYGNKITGQEVPNTYSERQQGNFFGGTFTGSGNTGYGVQFDAQGNPYFYTQGASSNDLANIMKDLGPIGQIAIAAATGGMSLPAQLATNAGIQLLAGGNLSDIAKGTALSYLGGQAGNLISGSSGVVDALGKTGTEIAANTAKQIVGSGGNVDPVQALLSSGLNTGLNSIASGIDMGSLTPEQQKLLTNSVVGLAKGQPLSTVLTNAAVSMAKSPSSSLTSSLGPGDAQEFSDSLIPGYFQPGGAGYIAPADQNPITVDQTPFNLDDFLSQLEQYKQGAVTTEDINRIISGQNFATPEDVQTAINSIDIPKGISEQDVQAIVSDAFAKNPNIKLDDVQDIVDNAVSKLPAGLNQEDLSRSIGASEKNILAQVGAQGEQFQTLFEQYRDLGMDADAALRQTIDDLGTNVGSQISDLGGQVSGLRENFKNQISDVNTNIADIAESLGTTKEELLSRLGTTEADLQKQIGGVQTGLESKLAGVQAGLGSQISQQGEQFQTLLQQYRDLGMNENDAIRQTIDDLGSNVSGQISQQGEQFQTLLQQYRDLGMDENEAIRQTIDDLGSNVSGQISQQSEQFQTLLQQYRDLGMDENEALRQTIDDLGSNVGSQISDLGGQVSGLRENFKTQIEDVGTQITDIADALGTTKEDLLNQLNLSEEELRSLIGGVGEQTKTALASQAAAQQAQAKAQAAQNTALSNALSQVQSTSNLNTLMMLMNDGQQPAQQTTMQDPYAHIKLMEDLFGSDIDLTPAGEDTAQRK